MPKRSNNKIKYLSKSLSYSSFKGLLKSSPYVYTLSKINALESIIQTIGSTELER